MGSAREPIFVAALLLCSISSLKLRCLLVSIDNRPFNRNVKENHYPTITAVLNKNYADFHGYDYLQLENVIDGLEISVKKKYAIHNEIPSTDNTKDAATAFHVGLQQFRAASWAKLPPLWDVTTKMGHKYDYIFYIDSDAVISPLHRNVSIDDLLSKYDSQSGWKNGMTRGQHDVRKAQFVFFNNFPWRDDMPCAGTFLFKPSNTSEAILREWWDFDLPSRNFKHFHEQDALWHMIDLQDDSNRYKMSLDTYTVLPERQFPSAWQRWEDLWLCHIASYNFALRNPILNIMLKSLSLKEEKAFIYAVDDVEIYRINSLAVTEAMEQKSSIDPQRIKKFPSSGVHYDIKKESGFWNTHVTSKNMTAPPLSDQFDGRVITRRGLFWLVLNGTKHGFSNFRSFTSLGFEPALAFPLRPQELSSLPNGDVVSTMTMSGLKVPGLEVYSLPHVNKNKDCSKVDSTSAPINSNGTRSLMYLIYHNNASELVAKKFIKCHESWIHMKKVRSTPFFESMLYPDILLPSKQQWIKLDYVITGTYKSVDEKGMTIKEVYRLLNIAREGDWDIVPFLRSGSGMMSFSLYFHKQPFKDAWDALLLEMGYSETMIRKYDETKPFFRNIFIIKPKVLDGLISFMSKAIDVVSTNERVRALFSKDSTYREGSIEVARRIFKTDYYQLHPFIFERLPNFFLHVIEAKICHAATGPCAYNT